MQTWMYVAVPVLLYAGERIYRVVRSGIYEIKNLTVYSKLIQVQGATIPGFILY